MESTGRPRVDATENLPDIYDLATSWSAPTCSKVNEHTEVNMYSETTPPISNGGNVKHEDDAIDTLYSVEAKQAVIGLLNDINNVGFDAAVTEEPEWKKIVDLEEITDDKSATPEVPEYGNTDESGGSGMAHTSVKESQLPTSETELESLDSPILTPRPETGYSCDMCGRPHKCLVILDKHMRSHRGQKPFACDMCDWRFTELDELKRHYKSHARRRWTTFYKKFTRQYVTMTVGGVAGTYRCSCQVCEKHSLERSASGSALKTRGDEPYACNMCDKSFAEQSGLTKHERRHTGEKPYSCESCNKQFAQHKSLSIHMRSHRRRSAGGPGDPGAKRVKTADRPEQVVDLTEDASDLSEDVDLSEETDNGCGDSVVEEDNGPRLERAVGSRGGGMGGEGGEGATQSPGDHAQGSGPKRGRGRARGRGLCEGQRPHACATCGKRFTRKEHCDRHQRDHCPNTKPFVCLRCDARFRTRDLLARHRVRHDRAAHDKPYKCDMCHREFIYEHNLSYHTRERICRQRHACEHCGAVFPQAHVLAAHVLRAHVRVVHRCGTCNRPFTKRSAMRKHELVHADARPYMYACSRCASSFAALASLRNHVARSHQGEPPPYQCARCRDLFPAADSLKQHVATRGCRPPPGELPYNCGICRAGFDSLDLFQEHARIHM